MALERVISGGQSGVDRAALRAAMEVGLAAGGWCPPGRAAEDGPIPSCFPLRETPGERSPAAPDIPRSLRTEWNVRDADAVLVLRPRDVPAGPGTAWTERCAARLGRPLLVCNPTDLEAARAIVAWLRSLDVGTLDVAGPSESTCPGIGDAAYTLLVHVLSTS